MVRVFILQSVDGVHFPCLTISKDLKMVFMGFCLALCLKEIMREKAGKFACCVRRTSPSSCGRQGVEPKKLPVAVAQSH